MIQFSFLMGKPMRVKQMTDSYQQARTLVSELENNYEIWIGDNDIHYTEVCLLAPREIPQGLLKTISIYGDMRVEGIREDKVEVSILI